MNTIIAYASIVALASALALPAFAMGRHDDKPHGVTKPATQQAQQPRRQATGGRHDEGPTTHGMPAAAKTGERTPPGR